MGKLAYEQKRALSGFLKALKALKSGEDECLDSYNRGKIQAYQTILAISGLYYRVLSLEILVLGVNDRVLP